MKLPKRTGTHILATTSEKAFLNALPDEWVVEKRTTDYGIDFDVEPYENGLFIGPKFVVQLKASCEEPSESPLRQRISVPTLFISASSMISRYWWCLPGIGAVVTRGRDTCC